MTRPRSRRAIAAAVLVAAVLVLIAVIAWSVASRDEGEAAEELKVDWASGERYAACVYDPASGTVAAALRITGESSRPQEVTVIVTAYTDENTSQPVGSARKSVSIDGPVDTVLRFTIRVDSTPHVGEDDVAACRREVEYSR
ncbi:hypothetical protein ABZ477_17540 [Microbacterium sp. NPDC019599]|uniref:hypothetical protein n=1 Tax=Microbacterium sp. NPDC019599 TaxID=3154690 RepID=UPI0033D753C9